MIAERSHEGVEYYGDGAALAADGLGLTRRDDRLCANCQAALRPRLLLGEVEIDLERRAARRGASILILTPMQWRLVQEIARWGDVATHHALVMALYGVDDRSARYSLKLLVYRFRRKLGRQAWRLRNHRLVGYSFETQSGVRAR